jgi:hypothetical protein
VGGDALSVEQAAAADGELSAHDGENEKADWDKLFAACFGDDLNGLEAAVKAYVDAMP